MKNFIFLIVFTFVFLSYAQGQIKDDKSIKIGFFGKGVYDFPEAWDNMKMTAQRFDPAKDIFAVRICSSDPLPVAVRMSYLSLSTRLAELETQGVFDYDWKTLKPTKWMYYVPRERVVFLRNDKNCQLRKNGLADTEFWIVPKNAEFPSFIEARRADSLAEKFITSGDSYFLGDAATETEKSSEKWKDLTPELFQKALQETVDFMKAHRTATAVVIISYTGKFPNKNLNNRFIELRQSLKQNDIGEHRVVVKEFSHKTDPQEKDDKMLYPSISIVYEK